MEKLITDISKIFENFFIGMFIVGIVLLIFGIGLILIGQCF